MYVQRLGFANAIIPDRPDLASPLLQLLIPSTRDESPVMLSSKEDFRLGFRGKC